MKSGNTKYYFVVYCNVIPINNLFWSSYVFRLGSPSLDKMSTEVAWERLQVIMVMDMCGWTREHCTMLQLGHRFGYWVFCRVDSCEMSPILELLVHTTKAVRHQVHQTCLWLLHLTTVTPVKDNKDTPGPRSLSFAASSAIKPNSMLSHYEAYLVISSFSKTTAYIVLATTWHYLQSILKQFLRCVEEQGYKEGWRLGRESLEWYVTWALLFTLQWHF